MMHVRSPLIAIAVGALLAVSASVSAGTAYPVRGMSAPRDLGMVGPSEATLTVTLPLKLRNAAAAEALLPQLSDKTSANYHHFLTPAQFKAQFAQSDADVAIVAAHLAAYGLTTERSGASTLRVTGTHANIERAFRVNLHTYEVSGSTGASLLRFRAPTSAPSIPAEISASVDAVVGLSTRPAYAPHHMRSPAKLAGAGIHAAAHGSGLINPPGSLTVADFAKYYDVLPLTAKHITGSGRTLAIVTLASFHEPDAYTYWRGVGLKVKSGRIGVVTVDGGPGAPSDASGSDETTLDVEQSGGIAPGANIIVYQAPNTNQAFLDAFVRAVDSNKADSISTSWGEWEWYDNLVNGPVTDPYSRETVSSLKALHEVLLQAALQGQSVFAAAGDAGAYDANDGQGQVPPDHSLALSVDNPASDSFITAGGGTTLAGTQTFSLNTGTFTVTVPHERVWSWDYLEPLCADLNQEPIECGIFPVGGGGGVSFAFPVPFYQEGVAGIQKTQPYQAFVDDDTIPPQTLIDIPAYYAGRNVPDVSFNADPDTGYVLFYTSDQSGYGEYTFNGGTSFVAPQLNGVVALIDEYVGGRLGLLNLPLYELAKNGGYAGKHAPLNAIKYGNNDFYTGRDGYSPAVGVGTLDVANFAEALKKSE